MDIKNCYVTKTRIGNGEYVVEGKTKGGRLVFGFRTFMDGLSTWMDKARTYASPRYLCIFDQYNSLKCEFDNGTAVVLDSSGKVLRQLVKYYRTKSGKIRFANMDVALTYFTKKEAIAACRDMGWPLDRVWDGESLIGRFWFIRNDFRDNYALACWKA